MDKKGKSLIKAFQDPEIAFEDIEDDFNSGISKNETRNQGEEISKPLNESSQSNLSIGIDEIHSLEAAAANVA